MILRLKIKVKLLWTKKDTGPPWFWDQRSNSNYSEHQKIEDCHDFEVKGQGQTTLDNKR